MRIFKVAEAYCGESGWKTLAALKFCLFSMGMMVGMKVPKEKKKWFYGIGGAIFLATYIPLMKKFFRLWDREKELEKIK